VPRGPAPALEVSDVTLTPPPAGRGAYRVTGRITNRSAFRAAPAWALVSLYGADGKIAGMGEQAVPGTGLDPAASATFDVSIAEVAAPVDTWAVKALGEHD
jgi:hypothetical protein